MSSSISGLSPNGYGIMSQLISDNSVLRNQEDTLTEQASSGLVSDTYAGLSGGGSVALNLNPQVSSLQTWQSNIDQATTTMTLTQSAMTQLQSIASTFYADTDNLNGLDATEVDSVAANARSALQQVASVLDTQDGSNYIFAGADSGNPPVPDPDDILSSGFYSQINAAVSSLSSNGATATIASTLATASSNASGTSPFSTYLSQPAASLSMAAVQVGPDQTVQIGIVASANSYANSSTTSTSTTGSYVRDLMRSLATLGSLNSTQINDTGFTALVSDTRTSLNGAVSAIDTDIGVLGNTQSNLSTMQTNMSSTATALTGQISNVEDVDMASTLTKLTQMNTQLQASYQLIANESSLSLVKFLSAS